MSQLYPLKFQPILKDKVWGSKQMQEVYPSKNIRSNNCGESWEISGVQDNISIVSNGVLAGNNLQDLIEIYMDELVGERVYEHFGIEFPLLIKFISTNDLLSVQVHPNDEVAKARHKAFGKTEMWYVIDTEKDSELIVGFNQTLSKDTFLESVMTKKITEVLNFEAVARKDVYFLPAGRVHAIGKGLLIAEIQQTSDITYRIHDWDRPDTDGTMRELHLDLAMDVLDLEKKDTYKTKYTTCNNIANQLVTCEYFTTNLIPFSNKVIKDYSALDSFVIYMCVEGNCMIEYNVTETIELANGETILIPASIDHVVLIPVSEKVEVLEVYIE